MRHVLLSALLLFGAPAAGLEGADRYPGTAALVGGIVEAAQREFRLVPDVRLVPRMAGLCGADARSDPLMGYCTSDNTIYVVGDLAVRVSGPEEAAYRVGHLLGHGVQVLNGIADVALARIRAERGREAALRGMVERQVDCIAGVLFVRAGLGTGGRLGDWVPGEPFAGPHWGRRPLARGPHLAIGLPTRAAAFDRGRARGDLADCGFGDFGPDLLLQARR